MSGEAKVRSIDAVRDFRIAYSKLTEEAQRSLDQRHIQIRKFVDWLSVDMRNHWIAECKLRKKEAAEAKNALARKKMGSGQKGAQHTTEQSQYRKAMTRLEEAERKLKAVTHWSAQVEQAVRNYDGQSRQLSSFLQTIAPQGVQMLDGVLQSLDAYTQRAESKSRSADPQSPQSPQKSQEDGSPSESGG